ncbi:hypothetical protein CJ030_MR7G017872, partial [Morella rubra]
KGLLINPSLSLIYFSYNPISLLKITMAQVSISKALMLVLLIAVSSAAAMVSALDSELAPAPAPTLDTGAAFSMPVSVVVLGSSLALSLLALLKL